MTDPDFPPWATPPTTRPAPEHLQHRIRADLAREHRRGRTYRAVIALAAAAVVLIAAVFGLSQLRTARDAVPAQTPTGSSDGSSASVSPPPSAAPTASSSPPAPRPQQINQLSEAQTAKDLKSCIESDPRTAADPTPHRGTYRAVLALDVPAITLNASEDRSFRLVSAEDEVGRYDCTDGREQGWSALGSNPLPTATREHPAVEQRGGGTSYSCDRRTRTGDAEFDVHWSTTKSVALARVQMKVNGQLTRAIDLAPHNGLVILAFRLSGASLYEKITWSVQFLDSSGEPVAIGSDQHHAVQSSTTIGDTAPTCDGAEEPAPPAIRRPTSDAAGVSACRKAVKAYVADAGATAFDVKSADPVLTVSTAQAWGTILSDGDQYVACSRYPTQEISGIRKVSDQIRAQTFGWAENPTDSGGESLWAAGKISGLRSVTYQLPDGQRVSGQVEPDGWWMVMTATATAFDTEENTADWKPVRVEVVTSTESRTFDLPWNEKTSCNQVSHGC